MSIVYFIGMMVLTYYGESGIFEVNKITNALKLLNEEIVVLTSENKKLEEEIYSLSNDSFLIERIVREQLGMVKKGEVVIEFVDP